MKSNREIKIPLVDSKGSQGFCTLKISEREPWIIEFEHLLPKKQTFHGKDLFDSLIQLRLYLEKNNYLLLCNGARVDVYPSGMSRDMSNGRLAYITKLGESTTKDSIVDIFDEANQINVGTVEQQKGFHARWVALINRV